MKKVAFEVIDFRPFLISIWRGIYKHESINTKNVNEHDSAFLGLYSH